MIDGVSLDHLVPHLVWAMKHGHPQERHWRATYGLSHEQTEELFNAARDRMAEEAREQADLVALKDRPEAESEAA